MLKCLEIGPGGTDCFQNEVENSDRIPAEPILVGKGSKQQSVVEVQPSGVQCISAPAGRHNNNYNDRLIDERRRCGTLATDPCCTE